MDLLFYRILLLFFGLGFLIWQNQSRFSKRVQVKLKKASFFLPQWSSPLDIPLQNPNLSSYFSPLRRVHWKDLVLLDPTSRSKLIQKLKQEERYLILHFRVFEDDWEEFQEAWKVLEKFPIRVWEWTPELRQAKNWAEEIPNPREWVQEFGLGYSSLKTHFPQSLSFAQAGFSEAKDSLSQVWNYFLSHQRNFMDGFILHLESKHLEQEHLENLSLMLRSNLRYALHLYGEFNPKTQSKLFKDVFLKVGARISYVHQDSQNRWENFGLIQLSAGSPKVKELEFYHAELDTRALKGLYWERKWENGLLLVNDSSQKFLLNTEDIFADRHFHISRDLEENADFQGEFHYSFSKLEISPQHWSRIYSRLIPDGIQNDVFDLKIVDDLPQGRLLKLNFHSDSDRHLRLRILNTRAEEIYYFQQNLTKKGSYELHLALQKLPLGLYLMLIAYDSKLQYQFLDLEDLVNG